MHQMTSDILNQQPGGLGCVQDPCRGMPRCAGDERVALSCGTPGMHENARAGKLDLVRAAVRLQEHEGDSHG